VQRGDSLRKAKTIPIPSPPMPSGIAADVVAAGPMIPPIERIRLFSDRQWEEFVLEWADSLRKHYTRVERCGGAGDMGRDVVAECKGTGDKWDNYQCKHYSEPLQPTDIWVELGKLIYHTYRKHYTYPRCYYFVAPQGAGTKLSNLFKNAEKLRTELFANWDSYCRKKITSTNEVKLTAKLVAYAKSLDFSIFEAVPPLRLIDQHAKTRWHIARFGGGLPERPPIPQPPADPTDFEANYIKQLFEAYSDHLDRPILNVTDIMSETNVHEHFRDSRLEFYSAESLRAFSRDPLPPGEFDKLQDEIYSGIGDEIRADYKDGYRRVLAVVKTARLLQITSHSLISRLTVRDRGGICHQLANDEKIRWVR
jgi:hypothetical protein